MAASELSYYRKLDLKVKVEEPIFVCPSGATPSGYLYLSNIDQLVKFPVPILLFYSSASTEKGRCDNDVVEIIKEAYGKVLVPYYFMAGRLKVRDKGGRHDIDCNGAGAVFVRATSHITLDEMGDLRQPNPAFRALVSFAQEPYVFPLPLLRVQVTTFKCGGFCIGLTMNHCLMDGFAAAEFLLNFSSIARGLHLPIIPNPNRTLLKPRCPTQINYNHIEYNAAIINPSALSPNRCITRVFNLNDNFIRKLKQRAKETGGPANCSTFEAVTSHVWQTRSKVLLQFQSEEDVENTKISFAVNIRNRLNPSLPHGFSGNGVLTTVANATAEEIEGQCLGFFAGKVREAAESLSDEYIRSAIDYSEENEVVFGVNGICVSAWWRLPFYDVDFGWGRPQYVCPLLSENPIFLLFLSAGASVPGIDMYVTLEPIAMEIFRASLFSEFHQ